MARVLVPNEVAIQAHMCMCKYIYVFTYIYNVHM